MRSVAFRCRLPTEILDSRTPWLLNCLLPEIPKTVIYLFLEPICLPNIVADTMTEKLPASLSMQVIQG